MFIRLRRIPRLLAVDESESKSRGAVWHFLKRMNAKQADSASNFGRRINPQRFDSSRERQSLSGTEPLKSQSDFEGRSESAGGKIERYHGFYPWGSKRTHDGG